MRPMTRFTRHLQVAAGLLWALAGTAYAGAYEDFFLAVGNDDVTVAMRLIDRGIDPNTTDPTGEPALIYALRKNALKVANALIDHPKININQPSAMRETPIMLAAFRGSKELVQKLIGRDAEINHPGWTPLHYAAANGHNEIVSLLLEHSAYIDAEAPNKTTPIMMAVRGGHIRTVKLLLDEGADINVKNDRGLGVLEFAEMNNHTEIVEGLRLRAKRDAERRAKPWR